MLPRFSQHPGPGDPRLALHLSESDGFRSHPETGPRGICRPMGSAFRRWRQWRNVLLWLCRVFWSIRPPVGASSVVLSLPLWTRCREHVGAAEASRRRFLCLRVDAQEWACWALGLAFIFSRNPTLFLGGCTMSIPTDARGPLFSRCLARLYDLARSHRGPLLPTEPSEGAVHAVFPLEGPPRSQPEEKSLSISKWKKVPFLIL